MKKHDQKESESYEVKLQDVQNIVQQLSDQDLEMDSLVSELERGYGLIKDLRTRLGETKMKVEELQEQYAEQEAP